MCICNSSRHASFVHSKMALSPLFEVAFLGSYQWDLSKPLSLPHATRWKGPLSMKNVDRISKRTPIFLALFSSSGFSLKYNFVMEQENLCLYRWVGSKVSHIVVRSVQASPKLCVSVESRCNGSSVLCSYSGTGRLILETKVPLGSSLQAGDFIQQVQQSMVVYNQISKLTDLRVLYKRKALHRNVWLVKSTNALKKR